MNVAAIAETQSITLPRWAWAIFCGGLLFLGSSVWETLKDDRVETGAALAEHDQQLKHHAEQIATIRAQMLTHDQAADLFNRQRLENKADFSAIREEIRSLRQELSQ